MLSISNSSSQKPKSVNPKGFEMYDYNMAKSQACLLRVGRSLFLLMKAYCWQRKGWCLWSYILYTRDCLGTVSRFIFSDLLVDILCWVSLWPKSPNKKQVQHGWAIVMNTPSQRIATENQTVFCLVLSAAPISACRSFGLHAHQRWVRGGTYTNARHKNIVALVFSLCPSPTLSHLLFHSHELVISNNFGVMLPR